MSYPPLTDYLADWRMDQIKGEDLQDPTAREQIRSLSQQVTTLSVSVADKVSKSGDTMTGDLNMGLGDELSASSNTVFFPSSTVAPTAQNFSGWRIRNAAGFLDFEGLNNGIATGYYRFRDNQEFKNPKDVMTAAAFVDTWRGYLFIDGARRMTFQLERTGESLFWKPLGPEEPTCPMISLSFSDSSWTCVTTLGTLTTSGAETDTLLRFEATVSNVEYVGVFFRNSGNAVALLSDFPLLVEGTLNITGAQKPYTLSISDINASLADVYDQAFNGRRVVMRLKTVIPEEVGNPQYVELPLTLITGSALKFSGSVLCMLKSFLPHDTMITVVWLLSSNTFTVIAEALADYDDVSNISTQVDSLSKGYEVNSSPTTSTSGTVITVTIVNRTVTPLTPASSVTAYTLTFPSSNSGHARDFIVQITATSALTVNLPSTGVTYYVPEGENLSDMTSFDASTSALLYFSEFAANKFAVHRVTLEDAV